MKLWKFLILLLALLGAGGTLLLGVNFLVVGDDFRFAKNRRGTIDSLRESGKRFGFSVEQAPSVLTIAFAVSTAPRRPRYAAQPQSPGGNMPSPGQRCTT